MLKMVFLDMGLTSEKYNLIIQNALTQVGEFKRYDSTDISQVLEHAQNAEIIIVNKTKITAECLADLPALKYIIVVATGYDNVDVKAATKLGVKVSNLPDYSAIIVAQHTFALILELTDKIGYLNEQVKIHGKWGGLKHKNLELTGLTLGLIGYGNIAKRIIPIAKAFGMNVLVNRNQNKAPGADENINFVDKKTLFTNSDFVSLHCPLTESTRHLINKNSLALMKPESYLINTSRGGLINENDLHHALVKNLIAGAALDVTEQEPINLDNPLLTLQNCLITPHVAWLSNKSLSRWASTTIELVHAYLNNQPFNLL